MYVFQWCCMENKWATDIFSLIASKFSFQRLLYYIGTLLYRKESLFFLCQRQKTQNQTLFFHHSQRVSAGNDGLLLGKKTPRRILELILSSLLLSCRIQNISFTVTKSIQQFSSYSFLLMLLFYWQCSAKGTVLLSVVGWFDWLLVLRHQLSFGKLSRVTRNSCDVSARLLESWFKYLITQWCK